MPVCPSSRTDSDLIFKHCQAQVQVQVSQRSGEGQVRVRKVRVRSESSELKDLTINLKAWTLAIPIPHHSSLFELDVNASQACLYSCRRLFIPRVTSKS